MGALTEAPEALYKFASRSESGMGRKLADLLKKHRAVIGAGAGGAAAGATVDHFMGDDDDEDDHMRRLHRHLMGE